MAVDVVAGQFTVVPIIETSGVSIFQGGRWQCSCMWKRSPLIGSAQTKAHVRDDEGAVWDVLDFDCSSSDIQFFSMSSRG